ncbi:sigma-54 interaction domain-containing protein [Chryseobacterium shandongense]|uniref:sigma-54 interaction domain-containing protein n=1 Tax=Chryseobacterium shandongense TaxID=1493872 RepID=UPI000F509AA4|nr:sigma-54 dependent transcriptional regulator [Chryseobacterium shandongense]AZA57138.1 sigma-54-dependent Fis family transcriptional regulator [Chryseobacterium shandongense]
MSKNDSQNTEIIQRLQSMQKELSIISTLNKSLATVLDEMDFQNVCTQNLKPEFAYDHFILLRKSNLDIEIFLSSTDHKINMSKNTSDVYFEKCLNSAEPLYIDLKELPDNSSTPYYFSNAKKDGMRIAVGLCLPSISNDQNVLYLFYKNYITADDFPERILLAVATQISITIRNILIGKQMQKRIQPDDEKIQEPSEDKKKQEGFQGIIGDSEEIKYIFERILQVAPSSTSVLIDGETGTGKELIAQAIHNFSSFSKKQMIKVNCASIPPNLIESELFGHEKGSFTGATEFRMGKFEQAQNSTIFLDEIGELPLELQGRLLRVLQEKDVQRIGSNNSVKLNIRVIAATNRDLQEEVAKGNFRSDLYYRLNVFPIHLPALRERKSDIPLLVNYFLQKHNLKANKKIKGFSQKMMKELCENPWFGNIRELENVIERSMITAQDEFITEIDFPKSIGLKKSEPEPEIKTLHQMEKEYILKVVEKCNGKIFGEYGAAILLGLPPTTLLSKMHRLGIKKDYQFKK